MAVHQSHISSSVFLALLYTGAGFVFLNLTPEHLLLAAIVVVITGLLPDIDGGGDFPAKDIGGLAAAALPLLLIEHFPALRAGDAARIALVVICGYLLTRMVIVRFLKSFTVRRGIIHSIPAAVIAGELTYLLLWDLRLSAKVFVAFGALIGYCSHLLLDAYSNIDIFGRAMGQSKKEPAVLKLFANSFKSTTAVYLTMMFLGWLVMKDLYPYLRVDAKLVY